MRTFFIIIGLTIMLSTFGIVWDVKESRRESRERAYHQSMLQSNAILAGTFRYNTFTGKAEIKDGTNWILYVNPRR